MLGFKNRVAFEGSLLAVIFGIGGGKPAPDKIKGMQADLRQIAFFNVGAVFRIEFELRPELGPFECLLHHPFLKVKEKSTAGAE